MTDAANQEYRFTGAHTKCQHRFHIGTEYDPGCTRRPESKGQCAVRRDHLTQQDITSDTGQDGCEREYGANRNRRCGLEPLKHEHKIGGHESTDDRIAPWLSRVFPFQPDRKCREHSHQWHRQDKPGGRHCNRINLIGNQ